MPGADGQGVPAGQVQHGVIGAGAAHQALARGFAEGQPEADAGHRADQGFVDVFHGLDEVGLAEDEVDLFRLVDGHADELHEKRLQPPWKA
ncbi:hypothetical protein D3C72_2217670 [compost metagenome]